MVGQMWVFVLHCVHQELFQITFVCVCVCPQSSPLILRGVGLGVALQEEAHALLMRPVGVEAWHHHDLPRQVPDEAGRAEH